MLSVTFLLFCRVSLCRVSLVLISLCPSVVMPSVIIPVVVMPSAVMLNVFMPNVVIPSAVKLNDVMLSVVTPSAVMVNDVMLSVVKLSGVGSFVIYLTSNLFKNLNQSVAKSFMKLTPAKRRADSLIEKFEKISLKRLLLKKGNTIEGSLLYILITFIMNVKLYFMNRVSKVNLVK
jgi:hypothetical protein